MSRTYPRLHSLHWLVGPSTSPERYERRVRISWIRIAGKRSGFSVGVGMYYLGVYYQH